MEAGAVRVLCGDGDGTVRRRDIETGKVMDEIQAHSGHDPSVVSCK